MALIGLGGLVYWLVDAAPKTTVVKRPGSARVTPGAGLVGSNLVTPSYQPTTPGTIDGTDQGGGNYTANPDWEVGDYGAEEGVDYEGNPFVRSVAPLIPFEAKVIPYRHGVDYYFADQTAKGVALFKRFPEFYLADVKLHFMGPWYNNAGANAHFSRGVETMTAFPYFRQGPTNVLFLPAERKNTMFGDDLFWALAGTRAQQIGAGDPRYNALINLAFSRQLDLDQNAYESLGRWAWEQERNTTDSNGQGTRYMSLDIEISQPYTNYRHIVGWMYDGYLSAALESGITVRPVTYYGPEQVLIGDLSDRQGGTGDPEYLTEYWDFLANSGDPTISSISRWGGIFANDTYMQAIWGLEPLYEYNGDGSILIDGNGYPIFSSRTSTTAYGQTIPLEFGEAELCLRDLYEQSVRLYLLNHRMAGGYPSRGGMRRPGLESTETGSFTRYTNEGVQGVVLNDRPVPAWQLSLFTSLNMFLTQHLWCWGVDFNHEPGELGSNHSDIWPYQAHGVAESIINAAHRHAAFSNIQNSQFKWCWFNLAIVNHMRTEGDGYHQKALCHAKIRNVSGTAWLEVWFAFPASDNRSTLFQVFVEQGNLRSVTFECELQSGRHYFYDCFLLPQSFDYESLEGENVYVSYPDALNVQRVHRGNYQQPVSTS